MSLTKNEMLRKAIYNSRYVTFIYKKDCTVRTVEVYEYYLDTKGQLKVWAYQPKGLNNGSGGVRSFLVENMTYIELGDEHDSRYMEPAPMVKDLLAI